jgi:drug/metabolite transporter (DMT)-like permease
VTFGYLFIRSSAKTENIHVVALVAGLAIVFYGAFGRLAAPAAPAAPLPSPLEIAFLLATGAIMYALYHMTVKLYRKLDLAVAEYPTLVAALLVLPLETALLGTRFEAWYIAAMVANTGFLGYVLTLKRKSPQGIN